MRIYAIGDLHMPGSTGKEMHVFGDHWRGHLDKIARDWDRRVEEADVVLVAGDLSWAMRLEEAQEDLDWLGQRPGRKILIRGNHDHWWSAIGKVRKALPQGCHALQNDVFCDEETGLGVAGARLWDMPGLKLGDIFQPPIEGSPAKSWQEPEEPERKERIYRRELGRLERSLALLPPWARHRVVLLHYPPTNHELVTTEVTSLLERFGVDHCVFGHLHALRPNVRFGGGKDGVCYHLCSADYLDFKLLEVAKLPS